MSTHASKRIVRTINNGVLLTTADRQIESLMKMGSKAQTFTESLYEAVLFHQGVVLPDIFAFISSVIDEQTISSTKTDLEYAIESGVVVPALRSDAESFSAALDRIVEINIRGVNRNARATAIRLDEARDACKYGFLNISWPTNISKQYAAWVISALEEISSASAEMSPLKPNLSLSAEFIDTHRLVDRLQEEISRGNGDLRRGFLMESILCILNSINDSGRVIFEDVENLIAHPACAENAELSVAVRNIICLSNLIYQRNMASMFDSNTYLAGNVYPKSVHDVAAVAIEKSSPRKSMLTPIESSDQGEFAKFQVTIPSIHQLKAVGMKRLLEIRDIHRHGYFSCLKAWQDGEGSCEDVERSLRDYSHALTQAVNSEAPFVNVVLARFAESIQAAAKLAMNVLAEYNLLPKCFSAAFGLSANITYSWLNQRPIEISHSRRANIVV